jgi:NADH dehydrogenase FAD-containing subunit
MRVVVVGGGYGGIAVARALDDVADAPHPEVTLVEPRDAFVHNVAALRCLVDPAWTDRVFLPYDRLLARGRIVRDHAVAVTATAVTTSSGDRIAADYIVLATGSAYPFPAKFAPADSRSTVATIHTAHENLAAAASVLLVGAGPVGLELAGEIKAAWPDKAVALVDPAAEILGGGFTTEFRTELRRQLDALGVELILGTTLREEPPTEPGDAKTFVVRTVSGREITADIWYRCYGVTPISGYLAPELANARRPDGALEVTPQLRLPGQDTVFAIGDLTAIAEPKMAKAAGLHAAVVAANIQALMRGDRELATYRPGPPGLSLPLGPAGGASYSAEMGMLDAATTARLKGVDLKVDTYRELLRLI